MQDPARRGRRSDSPTLEEGFLGPVSGGSLAVWSSNVDRPAPLTRCRCCGRLDQERWKATGTIRFLHCWQQVKSASDQALPASLQFVLHRSWAKFSSTVDHQCDTRIQTTHMPGSWLQLLAQVSRCLKRIPGEHHRMNLSAHESVARGLTLSGQQHVIVSASRVSPGGCDE